MSIVLQSLLVADVAKGIAQSDLLDECADVVSGDVVHEQLPADLLSNTPRSYPSASRIPTLLQLGLGLDDLAPLYLRDADAKLPNLPPNPIGH
jgi:hypothetical protein